MLNKKKVVVSKFSDWFFAFTKDRGELKEIGSFGKWLVASAKDFRRRENEVLVSKFSDFALSLFKKIVLNKKIIGCLERW